jgi:hypothetical protein
MDLAARNRTNHPRSVRAAKLAYSVKRTAERRVRIPGRIREPLRRVYQRANTGEAPRGMTPELRGELEELYRDSNGQTAAALRASGYAELPRWLSEAARAD